MLSATKEVRSWQGSKEAETLSKRRHPRVHCMGAWNLGPEGYVPFWQVETVVQGGASSAISEINPSENHRG